MFDVIFSQGGLQMRAHFFRILTILAALSFGTTSLHCGSDSVPAKCSNNTDCKGENQFCSPTSQTCQVCVAPKSCQDLEKECGQWDDGCNKAVDCGVCTGGKTCNNVLGKCEICGPDCGSRVCGPVPNG